MADFGVYRGREFLSLELKKRDFLIDQIMREKDSVLLVGGEKAGKSLLIKQLICSMTVGEDHPFLDEFEVRKACKVTYIQIEGELSDTQDRFKRMIKALDFNPDNFQLIFSEPMGLQEKANGFKLIADIESMHKPDVIIVDPLYFAFSGSLSDDEIVREFLGNIRRIKDHFGCAVIIVHHTHKVRFNNNGELLDEGDDALFGSSALKWWPDHLIFFTYNKKRNIREFRCSTQRSGDILPKIELILEQPDPLYFRNVKGCDTATGVSIADLLKSFKEPMTCNEICEKLKIARSTFYRDIKPLLKSKLVKKNDEHRPVKYHT